ncbi:MAG: hypothetical protein DI535_04110 [Citrobacter freundii]|nr:MAG: hypothetical protein DI535_04110 [Citrobacter freundii]
MALLKSIGRIFLSYLLWIVLIDIGGALLVTILPGPDSYTFSGHAGYGSIALYYVVWMVAGCLAGAFFTISFKTGNEKDLPQPKPILIFIIALLLSAALICFFYSVGEMARPDRDYSGNYYVPGNRYMTYTFFSSFLLITFLLLNDKKS